MRVAPLLHRTELAGGPEARPTYGTSTTGACQ
jgi:hypothetical protein